MWIKFADHDPAEEDFTDRDQIMVWHVYQESLVLHRDFMRFTAMCTHWMPIPQDGWHFLVNSAPPTADDADVMNCVLVMEQDLNGNKIYRVIGYHRVSSTMGILAWQKTPAPPANYKELRKLF